MRPVPIAYKTFYKPLYINQSVENVVYSSISKTITLREKLLADYTKPLIHASLNKMKLKEYPKSLFTALRLALTPKESLGKNSRPAEEPVIVTFTSIPSRLHVLSTTVRSLLNQSIQPERIVLWLNHNLRASYRAH